MTDEDRESTESWVDLLRDCRRRGMRAPVLATGHGALGFWAVLREAFPQTRQQRRRFQRMANVLAALPKSAHPAATRVMEEISNAEDGDHARVAVKAFQIDYGTKFPKAPARIADDLDVLLEFYDYQAEQWVHLGITNPIESTFLPPSGTTGARSPRAPIPARPAWRWHSSSSRPPSPGDRP